MTGRERRRKNAPRAVFRLWVGAPAAPRPPCTHPSAGALGAEHPGRGVTRGRRSVARGWNGGEAFRGERWWLLPARGRALSRTRSDPNLTSLSLPPLSLSLSIPHVGGPGHHHHQHQAAAAVTRPRLQRGQSGSCQWGRGRAVRGEEGCPAAAAVPAPVFVFLFRFWGGGGGGGAFRAWRVCVCVCVSKTRASYRAAPHWKGRDRESGGCPRKRGKGQGKKKGRQPSPTARARVRVSAPRTLSRHSIIPRPLPPAARRRRLPHHAPLNRAPAAKQERQTHPPQKKMHPKK